MPQYFFHSHHKNKWNHILTLLSTIELNFLVSFQQLDTFSFIIENRKSNEHPNQPISNEHTISLQRAETLTSFSHPQAFVQMLKSLHHHFSRFKSTLHQFNEWFEADRHEYDIRYNYDICNGYYDRVENQRTFFKAFCDDLRRHVQEALYLFTSHLKDSCKFRKCFPLRTVNRETSPGSRTQMGEIVKTFKNYVASFSVLIGNVGKLDILVRRQCVYFRKVSSATPADIVLWLPVH